MTLRLPVDEPTGSRRAAFIDRDGVINDDRGYVHRVDDFSLLPGAITGLQKLQQAGYLLVVVTNQAGVARGLYTQMQMHTLHAHMKAVLAQHGVHLHAVMHCPHHPQGTVVEFARSCECRKPAPGLILAAAQELGINLSMSLLVGDKVSDIQAGFSAGVPRCILVESGCALDDAARAQATHVCADLHQAACWAVGAET